MPFDGWDAPTFWIMTLSIMTLSIMTFSITTLNIKVLFVTHSISNTQYYKTLAVW